MIASHPGPRRGPAWDVPLRYLLAAAAAFIVAALGVAWLGPELAGHYYHPRIAALTHTVTLGWITLAIMGASYQLIPVVLDCPLWSERLARWQFWILVPSVIGMVAHFYIGTWPGLVMAAGLVAGGVALHLANVIMSVRGCGRWTFTARLVALAYVGLGLTVVFGLLLGLDHLWTFLPREVFPTLHAHIQLALLGWITPMMLGVAARVYPLFLLAPEPKGWPARVQLWGLAAGVPAVVSGLLFVAPPLLIAGALAVAAAVTGHAVWLVAMARHRRRPQLDWGLRFALTGALFIAPGTLLGLGLSLGVIAGPRLGLVYAVLVLGGWISLTLVGMMLKIVPFLVWYRVYSPRAGKVPVPTLAQLSWPRAEGIAYLLLTAGLVGLVVAVAGGNGAWIRAAGLVLSLGALAFGGALSRVLSHLGHRASVEDPAASRGAAGPMQPREAK
jgi:hypothetical protein